MNINGLQKLTLLDFPGRTACTVFLAGCDLRCPFCHNADLLDGSAEVVMDDRDLLAFLEKRRGLLDGVAFTGGEPLLRRDLPALMEKIRALGYAVKLDTNGCHPDALAAVLDRGLVDYIAMDIKNSPQRYAATAGLKVMDLGRIEQSIALIRASGGFIAAPSANLSGRPSTTSAEHVIEDLSGRVDMILAGGRSAIGLESTIVDLTEEIPTSSRRLLLLTCLKITEWRSRTSRATSACRERAPFTDLSFAPSLRRCILTSKYSPFRAIHVGWISLSDSRSMHFPQLYRPICGCISIRRCQIRSSVPCLTMSTTCSDAISTTRTPLDLSRTSVAVMQTLIRAGRSLRAVCS